MTDTSARSSGAGGDVIITATESITITGENSGILSTTEGGGAGGSICLHTPTLIMADGGRLRSASSGAGNAGDIEVTADRVRLTGSAEISTEATQADRGDIGITAQTLVWLQGSAITASVEGGAETDGGNININSELVVLQNSNIIADALDGQGGNIRITAAGYVADTDSRVSASSERGIDGTVDVQTLTDLSSNVVPLSHDFAGTQALFQDRCAIRLRQGMGSSFILRGHAGIPAAPGGFLPGLRDNRIHETAASHGLTATPD